MNKEQTKALMLYCDMTFGHKDISITKCIEYLDADAKCIGMNRLEFLYMLWLMMDCCKQ